jgi:hypothetical protein
MITNQIKEAFNINKNHNESKEIFNMKLLSN